VEGLLPHFLMLHRMMRKTLAPRIGYLETILAYERNMLFALMKPGHFDVFEYTMDEIWNISTNLLRLFGVLTTKGEKRVIFISIFQSSVCGL
jgi:hypothetical protein